MSNRMNIRLTCPPCLSQYKQSSIQVIDRATLKLQQSKDVFRCDELADICIDGSTFVIYDWQTGAAYEKSLYLNSSSVARINAAGSGEWFGCRVERAFMAANRGSKNNYYHWTTQSIISIIYFLPYLREANIPIIIPPCRHAYQLFWMEILAATYGLNFLCLGDGQSVHVSKLLVPSTLYKPFDFAPFIESDQIYKVLHESGIGRLQSISSSPEKVYVSRVHARRRRMVNEAKVEKIVKAHDYAIVNLEKLNVGDQVRLFMNCKKIMSPHGAGLANLVFSNPQSLAEVQEITSPLYFNPCFLAIAHRLQMEEYNVILATPLGLPDQAVGRHCREFRMNIATLKQLLSA